MAKATDPAASSARLSRLWRYFGLAPIGTVTHVKTQQPFVALTFDDGPHLDSTPELLACLEKHKAYATFFMVGVAAQRYPEIVRRVGQAGHAIGVHSWDHPSFPLVSRRERWDQIRRCAQQLHPFGQRLFRPPYGHQNLASRLDVLWLGYRVVTWNVVARDWLDDDGPTMAERVIGKLRPGAIVLFHDGLFDSLQVRYSDRQPMLEAVRLILERLAGRYRFVTVPELLRHGRPQHSLWLRQADPQWLSALKRADGPARAYPF